MNTNRTLMHTRSVTFQGYRRDDGLWDIEAEMSDIRNYDSIVLEKNLLPAQQPVHNISIKLTVDDDLTIQAISTRMKETPFGECLQVENTLQGMLGVTMRSGWRKAIDQHLGGIQGCTHLRELLYNMATAAFQTIPSYQSHQRRQAGMHDNSITKAPHYLGSCHSWRLDGPVVMRYLPQFYRRQADDGQQ